MAPAPKGGEKHQNYKPKRTVSNIALQRLLENYLHTRIVGTGVGQSPKAELPHQKIPNGFNLQSPVLLDHPLMSENKVSLSTENPELLHEIDKTKMTEKKRSFSLCRAPPVSRAQQPEQGKQATIFIIPTYYFSKNIPI